ncbi:MAG: glycosyltransferase family 9 protein [Deltaproteobacteria bacterium]|nr:glycosyltransferase family 9 protein [Deltaproteobacteria bacterium]
MIIKGGKTFNRKITNILIIQLGDIGDIVWSTPTFRAVKDAYPQAKVSILLRDGFGSLIKADPSLHRIFEVKRHGGNLLQKARAQCSFIRNLRREHFDLVFDLRLDDRGAYMAFISGAPIRVSISDQHFKWRNRLFTHLVVPLIPDERIHGAAEQSLRIIREFNITPHDTNPKLWIEDNVMEKACQLLDKKGLSSTAKWVSLNPFSRWPYKEWSYEKWVDIIDWMWEEYTIPVVIVGSQEEMKRAGFIERESRGCVFNLAGRTTLDELTGLLFLSHLHVGVDSAAPHIAAAVDTPTITVYGPSDWHDWAPQGENHRVITPERDCAPCHQKGCNNTGTSKCLEELQTDTVKRAIREFLGDKKNRSV